MIARRAGLLVLMTLGLSGAARAQTTPLYAPVTLQVACGDVFQSPCAKVLPRLAARAAQAGLDLKPVATGDARGSAEAVCKAQAAAAILPRDTAVEMSRDAVCLGRYDIVGRGLYPVYALLAVRANSRFRQFDDLTRDGRRAALAAGDLGSASQTTLGILLRSDREAPRDVTVTDDTFDEAASYLDDQTIDGFFAVESLDSGLIDSIRLKRDANGKPLYRFIDVRPGETLSRAGDGFGRCLYRLTALDFGGAAPVTTLSTDAVMIIARAARDAHAHSGPPAGEVLASAIASSGAGILSDMKSPADWRPAAGSCQ